MSEYSAIKNIKLDYARTTPGAVTEANYFYFDNSLNSKSEISIIYGGFEKTASDFELSRKSYPWYVLEFPVNGSCELIIEGRSCILKNGAIVSFSPGRAHRYRSDFRDPMEHFFIVFAGHEAGRLFSNAGFDIQPDQEAYDFQRASELFGDIMRSVNSGTRYSQKLANTYLKTLLLEQAEFNHQNQRVLSGPEKTFRRCRSYIEENFSGIKLPVEVAGACDINVRYMSRLFKQFYDCSPQQYIMRLKLNKAAVLLLSFDLTISQIAYQVGFDDPYHFSKSFKKHYNRSPLAYRNSHGI